MWIPVEPRNIPQPIQSVSDVQLLPLGTVIRAKEPIHGEGEFIYLAGAANTVAGDQVTYNPLTGATTRGAATANSGLPIAFAMANCIAARFGWYQISGVSLANNNATAAVGSAFQKATAQIGSAAVAGTQVLGGAQILVANNSTFTKVCTTRNGSTQLIVPDMDGLYIGLGVSGAGIPGGVTIAEGIDGGPNASNTSAGSSGVINLSAAATADGTVVVTFTRSNKSLIGGHRYFAQGQIT